MKFRHLHLGLSCGILALSLLPAAHAAGKTAAVTASSLSASSTASAGAVSGTLTSGGKVVANATLSAYALDVTARTGMSWRTLTGTVPAGAASAIIAVRGGIEGACICAGAGGATVGDVWYTEPNTGNTHDVSPVTVPVANAPVSVRTYALVPGQSISSNLAQFAVTSGASYGAYVAIAATGSASSAGYVGVIFLDASGRELRRDKIWFTPTQIGLPNATTNASGQYQLSVPAAVAAVWPEIHVSYTGSATTQATSSVIASTATAAQAQMPALAQQLPTATQLAGAKLGWFSPREDFLGAIAQGQTWDQLLLQWSSSAQHIQAIRIPTSVLMAIPDSVLPGIFRAMDAHGLALGLEIGVANNYNEVACGAGVESYSDPGTANQVIQKVLNAGGKVSALLMDEPLWYGHYYTGANACNSTIQDEARRSAVVMKIYTAAFPNVAVGDIEPFPEVPLQPNWQADYASWVQAFYAATGTRISFLHVDFDWGNPAMYQYTAYPSVPAIQYVAQLAASAARSNGQGIGFILNGSQDATSDAVYAYTAQFHMDALAGAGVNPDQLAFETWAAYPSLTLPETDPNTLSGEVYYYFSKYN
ncbi:MAG TPA: hypothetical protein VFA75_01150 [Nevskia sp.]|nr:hypothetical protein [Nevskia sp.]